MNIAEYKILLVIVFYLFCSVAFAANPYDQIQSIVDRDRVKYDLPALSVSIQLPQENIPRNFVSGYYTLENKNKISPNTLFQIGSITKTFTATLVMQLIEQNKCHLNDTVGEWLPEYPRWKLITIKNLLNHTSGTYNYTHGENFDKNLRENPEKYWSLRELADLAYSHPVAFQPGQQYQYSNTDYILLGLIIEKANHQSLQKIFDEYLHKYHLKNTFYTPAGYPKNVLNRIAHGYNRDGTFKLNKDVTFVSMSFSQSAGAMISTPNDLIRWLNQLFLGKIISNQSLAEMQTLISTTDAKIINIKDFRQYHGSTKNSFMEIGGGLGMGLVYFPDQGLAWVHAGGTPGYESFYAYNPEKNFYITIAYSTKPKQPFIFIKIYHDIATIISKSL